MRIAMKARHFVLAFSLLVLLQTPALGDSAPATLRVAVGLRLAPYVLEDAVGGVEYEYVAMIMQKLGYGPDKHLAIKVTVRNIPTYRDPAVILVDQLKEIWIDAELDTIETSTWFPKLARKDYQIGVNNTGSAVDDPDQQFFENYACGSERNYTGYCNKDLEAMFVAQSTTADQDKRKHLVWDIDKKLQEDGARPIVYHTRLGTCYQPAVRGLTVMVNSQYNGWRMEDVWLDR